MISRITGIALAIDIIVCPKESFAGLVQTASGMGLPDLAGT